MKLISKLTALIIIASFIFVSCEDEKEEALRDCTFEMFPEKRREICRTFTGSLSSIDLSRVCLGD